MTIEGEAAHSGTLTGVLSEDVAQMRRRLYGDINADAHFRSFRIGATQLCICYMEGMADDNKIGAFILHACGMEEDRGASPRRWTSGELMERVLEIAQCEAEARPESLVRSVVSGMSAVLVDGSREALVVETRGYPARQVNRTTNESVVIGSQEGFVESLRTNVTLIRRYLPSSRLISEPMSAGSEFPCSLCLMYLEGTTDPGIVAALRDRIRRIDAPSVDGIGELQQYIEDRPFAILPQMLQTERPDRAASCLREGQAIVLAENSPYALVAPATVFHQLHASDDSFARWQYGTFLRVIRLCGVLLSVFLPGLYIALTSHHMHLIPMSLLTSSAEARANVPFPILVEILIMEFSFSLINEAGTRIPQQIGSALGIVGALILGQAAVAASIISPILIIIVALTGLGNYAVPDYGFSVGLILYRLFVILCGALLGLFGICIAGYCILLSVCGERSLGFPYALPLAPSRLHNPDILLRLPVWAQVHRALYGRRGASGEGGENP